jgi:hypothetical protein
MSSENMNQLERLNLAVQGILTEASRRRISAQVAAERIAEEILDNSRDEAEAWELLENLIEQLLILTPLIRATIYNGIANRLDDFAASGAWTLR